MLERVGGRDFLAVVSSPPFITGHQRGPDVTSNYIHASARARNKRKSISPKRWFKILNRDGFRCRYCGATGEQAKLQVDHIEAVSNGGSHDDENLVTACFECNIGKSNRDIINLEEDIKIRLFRIIYPLVRFEDGKEAAASAAFAFSQGVNDRLLEEAANMAVSGSQFLTFLSWINADESEQ